jgi:hypothetical protein
MDEHLKDSQSNAFGCVNRGDTRWIETPAYSAHTLSTQIGIFPPNNAVSGQT